MEGSLVNYHYLTSSKSSSDLLGTFEINKKIEYKKNLVISLSSLFLILEVLGFTAIYFFLYFYRIAFEFDQNSLIFSSDAPRILQYLIFYGVSSLVYLIFIYHYKIYHLRATSGLLDELFKVVKSYSFAVLITIGLSFLLKFNDFSRLVIVSYWLLAIIGSSILRIIKRQIFLSLANRGMVSKSVVIVGAGKVGKSLIEELLLHKWLGYHVVGYVDDNYDEPFEKDLYLGKTTDLNKILKSHVIDEIIITIPSERQLVNELINELRKIDVKIKIVPDMFNLVMSTVQIGSINALPVVTLVKTPMRGMGFIFKRCFDIVLSCIALIIVSPVMAITALLIKLDSRGPIIYRQRRIGKNGKFFNMLKFRSMVTNAEAMLSDLEDKNEVHGIAFKMKNDPRVTKIGKFIRKYSIDELPQLINVLKGDMSLVGPRPPLPYEVEKYGNWEWRRLEVLPGITGLWQVSGRSNLSFQQWMNLDIYYIENWSLGLDLKIILKTIPVVLKGEGAY
jgi:exopolysaccharide biosynthesis polyprenyl glycosylphosphotransferase